VLPPTSLLNQPLAIYDNVLPATISAPDTAASEQQADSMLPDEGSSFQSPVLTGMDQHILEQYATVTVRTYKEHERGHRAVEI
jgi:hypothetical protein